MMDKERREAVFGHYGNLYRAILNSIYPAKNSTGFPERNLSVNFSKAYETAAGAAGETAVSWFELQFGPNNHFHADAVIINETAGDMLIVESKRFSHPAKKILEISEDIDRIYDLLSELRAENEQGIIRIDLSKIRHGYGVILADVWTESRTKTDILNSYLAGMEAPGSADSFLNKYCKGYAQNREFPGLAYDVRSMKELPSLQQYSLASFLWQLI